MLGPAQDLFASIRRQYRQRMIAGALRRASADGRRHGARVVHMLHVPKTGGTAVKAALEEAQRPPNLRLLLHGHGMSLRNIPREDDVFFFLRDPVDRFVSGFDMRRREGRPRHYRAWDEAERRAFSRFESAQELALAVASASTSDRTEAERAMRSIPHVRNHLSDWLVSDAEVRARREHLMFVGWQERLDTDFAELVTLLGLPPTTLPDDGYVANRAARSDPRMGLSDDAAEIVRAWFADDYRLIGLLCELGLTTPPGHLRAVCEEAPAR